MKTYLLTGGAGFVGSNLAIRLKRDLGQDARVVALDNLKRRGSELNLPRLRQAGVEFVHGDIRSVEDLKSVGHADVVLECSAEPSVLAGYGESPQYLIQTNLMGTINCLEVARQWKSDFIFLSTSRVYPIATINHLRYKESDTRFELDPNQSVAGVSPQGFSEKLPLEGLRSLYGATKLASELVIREYMDMYGFRGVINRCGVISGPWQMGKVDQGVIVLWVANHIFGKPLSYIGFGGTGKQVRDVLHIDDLYDLLTIQLRDLDKHNGKIFNAGGGVKSSVSLQELTRLCQEVTGKTIPIKSVPENRPADIRCYLTDNAQVTQATGWAPKRDCRRLVTDVADWISSHKEALQPILCP